MNGPYFFGVAQEVDHGLVRRRLAVEEEDAVRVQVLERPVLSAEPRSRAPIPIVVAVPVAALRWRCDLLRSLGPGVCKPVMQSILAW